MDHLLLLLLAGVVASAAGDGAPEVTIHTGSLRGKWTATRDGRAIAAFEGIPFAQPPIGELRFQPPQPAKPWSGVRAADKPGDMCIQRNLFMQMEELEGSEDCLYINVYAPETTTRSKPLPVMVFIHGGGFISGTGFIYGPEFILDRDVVLVNFNYRLGPLGFASTGDDVMPGNYGMKDMVQALKWVRDNIRAFGGDPNLVLIFGESAGGAAVHLLTLSPLSKGLFHRAVAMSGTALAPWSYYPPAVARKRADQLGSLLGCPSEPSEELKKCLMTKSAAEITGTDKGFEEWMAHPMVPFKITQEPAGPGAFLDRQPEEVYAAGLAHDVPFMTGFTSHEGCIGVVPIAENPTFLKEFDERFEELAPMVFFADHYAEKQNKEAFQKLRKFYFGDGPIDKDSVTGFIDFMSDSYFVYSALETVKLLKKYHKSPVFLYEIAHPSDRSFATLFGAKAAEYGVCHADDLLHVFPLKMLFPKEPSSDDVAYSRKLVDLLVQFAYTGRPTEDGSWPAVATPEHAEYLHLGSPSDISMRSNFQPERMKLFDELTLPIGTSRVRRVALREEL